MDGSKASTVVSDLGDLGGLVIDFQSSRLYWTEWNTMKIQSSSLDGSKVVTLAHALKDRPFGIALIHERLFWSLPFANALQSSNTDGSEIRTVYNGTTGIRYLSVTGFILETEQSLVTGTIVPAYVF